jgi:hypothetical protein
MVKFSLLVLDIFAIILLGNKCRNFATGLPSARKGIISENK